MLFSLVLYIKIKIFHFLIMFVPEIMYNELRGYLHARVSGEETNLETATNYWNKILIECANRGFKKLLVERHFPQQLDVFDLQTLTRHIAALSLKFKIKLAHLESIISRPGVNEYAEDVVNEFGVNARVFESYIEAERWLLSN